MSFGQDRRVDAARLHELEKTPGGAVALDHAFAAGDEFVGFATFADALAKSAVAGPVAGAGGDEIAKTAEAVKRLRPRAQRRADPHHLGERAGEQGRLGVVAQAQTVAATGRDGVDVFQATAELHAGHVVAPIDPQGGAAQGDLHIGQKRLVERRAGRRRGGEHHRAGLARGDFGRVGRAGEAAHREVGQLRRHDLGGSQVGAELQALREGEHELEPGREAEVGAEPRRGLAQGLRGTGEHDDFGLHQHRRELVPDLDRLRQTVAGQVVGVFTRRGQRERLLEAARHERDRVAQTGKVKSEGRAPGAGADDDNVHAGPSRGRSRPRQKLKNASRRRPASPARSVAAGRRHRRPGAAWHAAVLGRSAVRRPPVFARAAFRALAA